MNEGRVTGVPDVTSLAEYIHEMSLQESLIVKSLNVIVLVGSPT